MLAFDINKKVKSLDPQLKKMIETGKIEGTEKLEQWISKFEEVAEINKLDKTKAISQINTINILLVVTSIIFFFIWFPLSFVFIIVAIFLRKTKNKLAKLNISDKYEEVYLPILYFLQSESSPKNKLKLSVDAIEPFRASLHEHKKLKPSQPRVRALNQYIYKTTPLKGKMLIADGNILVFTVELTYISIVKEKRSISGKIKNKYKYKSKYKIKSKLVVNESNYVITSENAVEKNGHKEIQTQEKLSGTTYSNRALNFDYAYFIGTIIDLYKQLQAKKAS